MTARTRSADADDPCLDAFFLLPKYPANLCAVHTCLLYVHTGRQTLLHATQKALRMEAGACPFESYASLQFSFPFVLSFSLLFFALNSVQYSQGVNVGPPFFPFRTLSALPARSETPPLSILFYSLLTVFALFMLLCVCGFRLLLASPC